MEELTSLERCRRVVRRQRPDRVPRAAAFTPAVYEKFRAATGEQDPHTYFRMDGVGVGPSGTSSQPDFRAWHRQDLPENAWFDEWGTGYTPGSMHHFTKYWFPLERAETVEDLESYPWPDFDNPSRYNHLAEQVEQLHWAGHFVMGTVGHIFETSWEVRKMEKLFEDFFERPEFATALLDHITELRRAMAVNQAAAGVDMVSCGDDIGMQDRLMMSPDLWRKWFKPRWQSLWASVKKVNPDCSLFYHSDGAIEPVIADLIEIGVEVLNPVQPECMDQQKLKRNYGDKLAFWGCIGTQSTMPFGTPSEVEASVRWCIENLGGDGGLFITPTHVLEPEVPWENIAALFAACDKYGAYS